MQQKTIDKIVPSYRQISLPLLCRSVRRSNGSQNDEFSIYDIPTTPTVARREPKAVFRGEEGRGEEMK